MIRYYETMLILHPEAGDEDRRKVLDLLKGLIEGFKGRVAKVDEWGKRRFAYPIQKLREGYYVIVQYSLNPEGLKEIERRLKLEEKVLRFQTIRLRKLELEDEKEEVEAKEEVS